MRIELHASVVLRINCCRFGWRDGGGVQDRVTNVVRDFIVCSRGRVRERIYKLSLSRFMYTIYTAAAAAVRLMFSDCGRRVNWFPARPPIPRRRADIPGSLLGRVCNYTRTPRKLFPSEISETNPPDDGRSRGGGSACCTVCAEVNRKRSLFPTRS